MADWPNMHTHTKCYIPIITDTTSTDTQQPCGAGGELSYMTEPSLCELQFTNHEGEKTGEQIKSYESFRCLLQKSFSIEPAIDSCMWIYQSFYKIYFVVKCVYILSVLLSVWLMHASHVCKALMLDFMSLRAGNVNWVCIVRMMCA